MTNNDLIKEIAAFDPMIYKRDDEEPIPVFTRSFKIQGLSELSKLMETMTIQGANEEDLLNLVKYSMVFIDAEKHNLNYSKAYADFKIEDIKKRYGEKERNDVKTEVRQGQD